MTLKEGIEKLGTLIANFNKVETPAKPDRIEGKFTDEKLNDGTTIISYDAPELATGVIVMLMPDMLPLPAGDYTTEAGDTFTVVDELGTIDNVILAPEPEANPEEVPAAPAPAPTAQEATPTTAPKRVIKSQVTEHVFSLETETDIFEVDLSPMFSAIVKENTELKELNSQMFAIVKQLADEPSATPTETKKAFNVSEFRKSFKDDLQKLEFELNK